MRWFALGACVVVGCASPSHGLRVERAQGVTPTLSTPIRVNPAPPVTSVPAKEPPKQQGTLALDSVKVDVIEIRTARTMAGTLVQDVRMTVQNMLMTGEIHEVLLDMPVFDANGQAIDRGPKQYHWVFRKPLGPGEKATDGVLFPQKPETALPVVESRPAVREVR